MQNTTNGNLNPTPEDAKREKSTVFAYTKIANTMLTVPNTNTNTFQNCLRFSDAQRYRFAVSVPIV